MNYMIINSVHAQAHYVQQQPIDLYDRLHRWNPHIDPAKIKVISIQAVIWNDGSLGCPIEEKCYTQALVPGYLIWLEHENMLIEVHTDESMAHFALPGVGFI
jgi:hypothetical protein